MKNTQNNLRSTKCINSSKLAPKIPSYLLFYIVLHVSMSVCDRGLIDYNQRDVIEIQTIHFQSLSLLFQLHMNRKI